MRKLAFAVVFGILATAPALAVNILSNPGFESGSLSPWFQAQDFGGPENWNVQSNIVHSGSFAATDVGNKLIYQAITPTPTSMITEVSFWIRNMDSGALINAVQLDYSDSTSSQFIITETNTDWQQFNVTSSLTSGKTLVGFGIWGFLGGGAGEDRTYLDDAVINAVPEPATLAAIGIGAAALLRRRRR